MLIFDGHNDALGRLWAGSSDPVADFAQDIGHVNAPACARGGMAGGFFAIFSPGVRKPFDLSIFANGNVDLPLPSALPEKQALVSAIGQAGIAQQLQKAGHLTICTSAQMLAEAFVSDSIACVLHLEGAECIGSDLLALEALHAMGLRSLGPVWARPTIWGEGVPFTYPTDGDTGPGLTEDGKRLVARCAALGVMIDTSHLTMKGFWDVGAAGLPLVATHSNAHALCPSSRNLTDDQLKAIAETGGMVGLNYGTLFLSEAGWMTGKAGIEDCLRQLDHMIAVAGEDHVGLGSDFDGAPLPEGLDDAGALPELVQAMHTHGYGNALIAKLCNENWLSFLSRHLG